jgi:sec-independent protein translocase protein TatA
MVAQAKLINYRHQRMILEKPHDSPCTLGYNNYTYHLKRRNAMRLGPTELIIILIIVLLLFGVGRIGKIAGELGSGIRAFKDGLQSDKENPSETPAVKEEKASKE